MFSFMTLGSVSSELSIKRGYNKPRDIPKAIAICNIDKKISLSFTGNQL